MGGRDTNMQWMRKRLWIPWQGSSGVTVSTILVSLKSTGATGTEINSTGMPGLEMVAGEFLHSYLRCPIDLNPDFPVGFRIYYTVNPSAAATATYILLQDTVAVGAAFAAASTALNTTIAADTYGSVAYITAVTERGIRNSIGLTRAQIEAGAMITTSTELDAVTNTTTHWYLGMEMDYAPMRTEGFGTHIDCPLDSDGVK